MVRNRSLAAWSILAAACGSFGGGASADLSDGQLEAGRADEWRFRISPSLWYAAVDGSVAVEGFESQVDGGLSDISGAWNFGGGARFEASKGPWGVQLDFGYLSVDETGDDPNVPTVIEIENAIDAVVLELGGVYRFYETALGDRQYSRWDIGVLGGLRYTDVDVDADILAAPPIGDRSSSEAWFDPFVGLETNLQWTRRLSSELRGDVGGFAGGARLAWQVAFFEHVRLTDSLALRIGYRHLAYEYEDGEGFDEFEFDTALSGPIFGFDIDF